MKIYGSKNVVEMAKGNTKTLGEALETKICNELARNEPHKNDRTHKRFPYLEQGLGEQRDGSKK